MFDIGWTELLVVACVAIIVVGPKDLPRMLRTFGQTMGKVRRMAREFQSTFNDAIREAEREVDLADMRKKVEAAANFDPLGDLKKSIAADPAKPAPPPPAEAGETKAAQSDPADTTAAPATFPAAPAAAPAAAPSGAPSSAEETKA
ncbi:Sec-independent protein translocase protein TatB [Polymorphum gilvum]|uniref:Sec-independent protein translocase protein TatB n=1 Tax=Polymorphum gilvum (strain LMG 25793 / CGMCC 1.9160 / SL003B-26A1) TaxID=991905 RepID=F2IZ06_POLGS|nr:Sec-independent protein translocase protein TatB [Polymorphum gilvum]ADZ70621.1 Twin arginine-targeting protein translocase TatB, putative [Polymorphum gilvum SL003B-26A1]